jgi:hypothetical protein
LISFDLNGAPEGIRTPGLCLRRAALYPAELRVQSARAPSVPLQYAEASGNRRRLRLVPASDDAGMTRYKAA